MKYNKINLIYSVTENNVMGVNGKLPFMVPEDLQMFKKLTTGNAVVMGRKTFDSLPEKFKPLPDRLNLILTTKYGESIRDTLLYLHKNNLYRDIKLIDNAIDLSDKESIDENTIDLYRFLLNKIATNNGFSINEDITDIHELKKLCRETLFKKYTYIDSKYLIAEEQVYDKELFFNDIDSLLDTFRYSFLMEFIKKDNFEIFIIGGKKVLEDFADKADNVYLTKVYTTTLEDKRNIVYGPDIDLDENFELVDRSGIKISSSGLKYEFLKYNKIEIQPEPYFGD